MDKLVGAGPRGADTQTMWIEEISRLCVLVCIGAPLARLLTNACLACRLTRDDTHIFAEPVDRTLYPEYYRAINSLSTKLFKVGTQE